MSVLVIIDKDPDAKRTYTIDWAKGGPNDASSDDRGFLQGDTIATSTFSVVGSELVIEQDGNTTTTTTVQVSGGVVGRQYDVTNRITLTTSTDIVDRTLRINIVPKK
jgi:hypothetical protein